MELFYWVENKVENKFAGVCVDTTCIGALGGVFDKCSKFVPGGREFDGENIYW